MTDAGGGNEDLVGIEAEFDEGMAGAEAYFDNLIAVSTDDPTRRAAIRDWIASVADRALTLDASLAPGDVGASYWSMLGAEPESPETIRAKLLSTGARGSPDYAEFREWVMSLPLHDRHGEPDHVLFSGLLLRAMALHVGSAAGEVRRMLDLHLRAIENPLPERVDRHLRRVARLYILGFDVEVAALARAALEAALVERTTDAAVRHLMAVPPSETIHLGHRIAAARKGGILSAEGERGATAIRLRGNNALHDGSGALSAVQGPLGIIDRLTKCLREIGTEPNA